MAHAPVAELGIETECFKTYVAACLNVAAHFRISFIMITRPFGNVFDDIVTYSIAEIPGSAFIMSLFRLFA
jgi:hypothetical protein